MGNGLISLCSLHQLSIIRALFKWLRGLQFFPDAAFHGHPNQGVVIFVMCRCHQRWHLLTVTRKYFRSTDSHKLAGMPLLSTSRLGMETRQPSLTWKGCPGILMLSISRFHVPLGGAAIGGPHRWDLKSRGEGGGEGHTKAGESYYYDYYREYMKTKQIQRI